MDDRQFIKEYALVQHALDSESGEEQLRMYLQSLVDSVVDEYLSVNTGMDIYKDKITSAGWSLLHVALKNYRKRVESRGNKKENMYCFSDYYMWYIRQGILEYVRSIGKESKNKTL